MTDLPVALLERVHHLAAELPAADVRQLAATLVAAPPGQWTTPRLQAQAALPGGAARDLAGRLIGDWHAQAPTLAPAELGLMLTTALYGVTLARRQTLELVWTGPDSPSPLRRTDQVLLQLIDEATGELLIVAYAVYKIPAVRAALLKAAGRGVRLTLVIESPDPAAGQTAYNNLLALGPQIAEVAHVYVWPLHKRPVALGGHVGSLHVKCAVADSRALLISSANLTAYALNLNMELGLFVHGGVVPAQVATHFRQLIAESILVLANSSH